MFYSNFDKIAGLLISIFKTSISIRLLDQFLIAIEVKNNEIENSNNDSKVNRID